MDQGAARISIVIPTFNRRDNLLHTLRLLDRQDTGDFDVVVVDDGSQDGTAAAVEALAPDLRYPVSVLRQANAGPATARNRGIAAARGAVTLMIGDDTYPGPDFVRRHAEHHAAHPGPAEAAVGYTRWSEEHQRVTPYMRWVGYHGLQFDYAHLFGGGEADWRHFYTSNLSLKTEYLRAHPFREDFPAAAMEDIELGYRLHQRHDLRMRFLPDAVLDHVHPMTFRQGCRRQVTVGKAARVFTRLWHDVSDEAPASHHWRSRLRRHPRALAALAWLGEKSLALRCPNAFAHQVIMLHQYAGYDEARRTEAAPA